MKKNGFVSMTLVYSFLILFLFLMLAILDAYSQMGRYKTAINENINLKVNTKYDYCEYYVGQEFTYAYTGFSQTFLSKCKGKYKIELWGADGAGTNGGKGGYTSGTINLNKGVNLFVYVGEEGKKVSGCNAISFNANTSGVCASGGGATDVRLKEGTTSTEWNNSSSLSSRIMVSAGGGGANVATGSGGNAGGYVGSEGTNASTTSKGGAKISTQTDYFTYFGSTNSLTSSTNSSGGGGGYFAGESSNNTNGGGGSSFVSGHSGCIAVIREGSSQPREINSTICDYNTTEADCSVHYSGYQFSDTRLIDGNGAIPSKPESTKNGYVRITFLAEL